MAMSKGPAVEESASRMTAAMGAQASPDTAGWRTERVSIRPADNGGFIVDCSKKRDLPPRTASNKAEPSNMNETYKSQDLAFSSIKEVVDFLNGEFGGDAGAAAAAPPATYSGDGFEDEPETPDQA